jgi:hypothetical protein
MRYIEVDLHSLPKPIKATIDLWQCLADGFTIKYNVNKKKYEPGDRFMRDGIEYEAIDAWSDGLEDCVGCDECALSVGGVDCNPYRCYAIDQSEKEVIFKKV